MKITKSERMLIEFVCILGQMFPVVNEDGDQSFDVDKTVNFINGSPALLDALRSVQKSL